MRYCLVVLGALVAAWLYAQEPDIQRYVEMVEAGNGDSVREQLPLLLKQYPNDPGVLYLQALLTADGADAVRQYQHIVDTYPNSEWADDALYKIYKFYYAIGLYRTAEMKLDQLRAKYPNSRYIAGMTIGEEPDTASVQRKESVRQPNEPVGTPAVVAEPEPNKQAPPTPPSERDERGTPAQRFTLQVGAYSTMANANRQKSFFDYHNYPADVVRTMRGDRELYIVYVGRFATEDEARRTGEQLRRSFNVDYIIVTR